jgi:hypothetical protein
MSSPIGRLTGAVLRIFADVAQVHLETGIGIPWRAWSQRSESLNRVFEALMLRHCLFASKIAPDMKSRGADRMAHAPDAIRINPAAI